MKVSAVEMPLTDLQEALDRYCKALGYVEVEKVLVMSHAKVVLTVELKPCGLV